MIVFRFFDEEMNRIGQDGKNAEELKNQNDKALGFKSDTKFDLTYPQGGYELAYVAQDNNMQDQTFVLLGECLAVLLNVAATPCG